MKTAPNDQKDAARYKLVRVPGRFAVLLNARAKAWSGSLHQEVLRYVPSQDLFLTDDFRQAKRTIDKLLCSDYEAIFAGGGDGTIMYLLNALEAKISEGAITRESAPILGVLRMGTGNALAHYLGADQIIDDLRALRSGAQLMIHTVNMIEGEEGLFPFAGFGWDADILNDYGEVKSLVRGRAVEPYVTGLGGYGVAIAARTIPRALLSSKAPRVRLTNLDDRAKRINGRGEVIKEYERGEQIYEGPMRACGASSIPYWGFQVRMFPYADAHQDFFQVRCFHGGVAEIVTHLRRFWRGEIREDSVVDVLAREIKVELLDEPLPYQVSGDVSGLEREIIWRVAKHPAHLATPLHS